MLPAMIESALDLIEAAMEQHQVVVELNGNMKLAEVDSRLGELKVSPRSAGGNY